MRNPDWRRSFRYAVVGAIALATAVSSGVLAQSAAWSRAKDPGPRPNPSSTIPSPVPGLNDNETSLFNESLLRVSELEGTCDTCSQQPQNVPPIDPDPKNPFSPLALVNSAGMSPVFNADQWVPFAAVSSWLTDRARVPAFAVEYWKPTHFEPIFDVAGNPLHHVFSGIDVTLAVREAIIYRVSYHITLVGKIVFREPME